MATCPHLHLLASLSPAKQHHSVHREECTQCFDNQDLPTGVDVCLTCFNGGCLSDERHHARTHFEKSGHPFVLNVKRKSKPRPERDDKEPPLKKLAIFEEREEDKYEHQTTLKCMSCGGVEIPPENDPKIKSLTDGVMHSMSSARQSEVKAWEDEITACEHTLMLDQSASKPIEASGLAHCGKCELKENLWLCLTCGHLGCGRAQFGGVGGNGHGLAHYEESKHPVSVKLGTITAEGTADVYCYACNDSRIDPEMGAHLSSFGINIHTQKKTQKSSTELQIEHNLNFDFSLIGEDGKALEPVYGPGLTGLANLGNSCYMASVLQTIFALPSFQQRYLPTGPMHALLCPEPLPASCLECQLNKIADGLLSGRYSHPRGRADPNAIMHSPSQDAADHTAPDFQEGLKPTMFKALVGKGHEEFSTMRQQDSEEFFQHLLKSIRQDTKKKGGKEEDQPTQVFRFGMEQRLQCGNCHKVRYRVDGQDSLSVPVPAIEKPTSAPQQANETPKVEYEPVLLTQCLEMSTGIEALEYSCPSCVKTVIAQKSVRFSTFPDILVIHAKKFQLVGWVPQKLDIPIIFPSDDTLSLDGYLGRGKQEGEVELPEDSAAAPAAPKFNGAALDQLQAMGFGVNACKRALLATGNADAEAATNWLFMHMEDPGKIRVDHPSLGQTNQVYHFGYPDLSEPVIAAGSGQGQSGPEPSADQISGLTDMGFTSAQARKALRETGGDPGRAIEWLFSHPDDMGEEAPSAGPGAPSTASNPTNPGGSAILPANYRLKAFVSHKGTSVHSGHYVAHIRHDKEGWVLFNDEKVVKADAESINTLKPLAYLYIFQRM
ncbi:hypothetical protein FRB94_014419 [Tulasnella sp. JGI-2019a]|nr:hypothetical protein FRB94_014419 [Tulasnella sp. JGI-2019a]